MDYVDYNVPFIRILMNQPVLFQVFEGCGKVHVEGPSLRKGRSSASRWFKGIFRQISNDHCYYIHKIVVWSHAEHRHEFRFKVWSTTNLHKILGHFELVLFFCFPLVKYCETHLQVTPKGNQVVWFSAMLHLLAKPQAILELILESWSIFLKQEPRFSLKRNTS